MLSILCILAASILSVQSHRRVPPERGRHVGQNINAIIVTEPCMTNPPMVPLRCNEVTISEAIAPNTALPATAMPVMPFITELPNCPDLYFKDILTSPIGCLDPILDVYGKTAAMPIAETTVLRAALSSLPGCDCQSHFLGRLSIPPPFI